MRTIFLPTAREASVSYSVHGGGRAVCLQGGLHPRGGGSATRGSAQPPHLVAATGAVGTRPTGMHSCFICNPMIPLPFPTLFFFRIIFFRIIGSVVR